MRREVDGVGRRVITETQRTQIFLTQIRTRTARQNTPSQPQNSIAGSERPRICRQPDWRHQRKIIPQDERQQIHSRINLRALESQGARGRKPQPYQFLRSKKAWIPRIMTRTPKQAKSGRSQPIPTDWTRKSQLKKSRN